MLLVEEEEEESGTDFDKAQQKLVLRFPFLLICATVEHQSVYSSSNRRVSA